MKNFKVLKVFAGLFATITILGFIFYLLVAKSSIQPEIVRILMDCHIFPASWTVERATAELITWGDWAILVSLCSVIIQILFMNGAFHAAKTAIEGQYPSTVQTTIYMNNAKDEKAMRKEAAKEAKVAKKAAKLAEKKARKEKETEAKIIAKEKAIAEKAAVSAKKVKARKVKEAELKAAQAPSKENEIENILKGMK